ncbi:hypothetical protein SSX86_010947 [Deinandra increscens subsp. villosa]|uniref:RRM domain-containing protein n=1 Tax=Deinandra increscens subsp. villosa TaxID=3103831 RepID=A0AAP0H5D3_9ASTR
MYPDFKHLETNVSLKGSDPWLAKPQDAYGEISVLQDQLLQLKFDVDEVEDGRLVINPWRLESCGFGFVSMFSIYEADRCIRYLDGYVLEGHVIIVEKVNISAEANCENQMLHLLIEGLTAFNKGTTELLFGADNPILHQQIVAIIQCLLGIWTLRVATAMIEQNFHGAKVLISYPTWGTNSTLRSSEADKM